MDRSEVYRIIDGERDYQDAMKVGPDGRTDGRQKSVGDYLALIRVASANADVAYYGVPGDVPAMAVVRKIAAICVQCMEVHGAPPRAAAVLGYKGEQEAPPVAECDCHRCLHERDARINGIPTASARMILCPTCGNKRCPHASDHRNACTGSNARGQKGSLYQ